jgi:MYND finger
MGKISKRPSRGRINKEAHSQAIRARHRTAIIADPKEVKDSLIEEVEHSLSTGDPKVLKDNLREKYMAKKDGQRIPFKALAMYVCILDKSAHETNPKDYFTSFFTRQDYKYLKSILKAESNAHFLRAFAAMQLSNFKLFDCEFVDSNQYAQIAVKLAIQARGCPRVREFKLLGKAEDVEKAARERLAWKNMGGDACDYCWKKVEETENDTLQCCSFCQITFYCSRECQKLHWECEHKSQCRKPGKYKVGDLVIFAQHDAAIQAGEIVKIISPAPNEDHLKRPKNWVVQACCSRTRLVLSDSQLITVAAKNLRRLRHRADGWEPAPFWVWVLRVLAVPALVFLAWAPYCT